MKTYTVPIKKNEEHETSFGILAVPEAMMGREPYYVYYDEVDDEFWLSRYTPDELANLTAVAVRRVVRERSQRVQEHIVTLYPRNDEHLGVLFLEIVAFHTQHTKVEFS